MNAIPDWIAQQNAQKKADEERQAESSRRAVQDSFTFAAQAPDVWLRFANTLKLHAEALSQLEGRELFGSTTPVGPPPISFRVGVDRRSVRRGPNLTYTVFHYDRAGSDEIRVNHHVNGGAAGVPLTLKLGPDGRVGFFHHYKMVTPEKMAENIIRDMAENASR